MQNRTYYQILGVLPNASDTEIRRAYRQAALEHHPDRTSYSKETSEEKMKELNEAYAVLSDSQKKAAYDRSMGQNLRRAAEQTPLTSKGSSSLYSNHTKKELIRVNLPTLAFFTGKINHVDDKTIMNVVLLGSKNAGKSLFVENLYDFFTFHRTATIGVDFRDYSPTNDLKFRIYDVAGQENILRFSPYHRKANLVLIFDEVEKYLERCKTSFSAHIEECQIVPLNYHQGKCQLGDAVSYKNFELKNIKMESYEPYSAYELSKNLFMNLELMLKATLQFSHNVVVLDQQQGFNRRPGCM